MSKDTVNTRRIKLLLERDGPYSRSKFKVLSLLEMVYREAKKKDNDTYYLSIKRIAVFSGVPYYSLGSLLKRYGACGYVRGRYRGGIGEPYSEGWTEYALATKGLKWLRKAEEYLPNASRFSQELSDQIDRVSPLVNSLLRLPFKDFLSELNILSIPGTE